jgi:mevalonate kinase
MDHVIRDRLKDLKLENLSGSINIKIKTEIPQGAGLGSSAAFGAVLSGCICQAIQFLSKSDSLNSEQFSELVWSYTNVFECLQHGKPSGCDAAVIVQGGLICYRRADPPEVTEIVDLKEHISKI